MPTPRKSEEVPCQHRTWLFSFNKSKGVFQADGRSNGTGRRANLGSGPREDALRQLCAFDQVVALERGEITREAVSRGRDYSVTVIDGFDSYLDDLRRKQAARQTRESTLKRYTAVR